MSEDRRFIRVFGKREVELAAMAITDAGLFEREFTRAEVLRAGDPAGYVDRGLSILVEWQFLVPAGAGRVRCAPEFTARCQAAVARDRAEGITT